MVKNILRYRILKNEKNEKSTRSTVCRSVSNGVRFGDNKYNKPSTIPGNTKLNKSINKNNRNTNLKKYTSKARK